MLALKSLDLRCRKMLPVRFVIRLIPSFRSLKWIFRHDETTRRLSLSAPSSRKSTLCGSKLCRSQFRSLGAIMADHGDLESMENFRQTGPQYLGNGKWTAILCEWSCLGAKEVDADHGKLELFCEGHFVQSIFRRLPLSKVGKNRRFHGGIIIKTKCSMNI